MFALRYSQIITNRRCYITLGFVWTFSFLLPLLQLWWIQPTDYDPDESIPEEHLNKEVAYCIASLVVYLFAPTGFMAFTVSHDASRSTATESSTNFKRAGGFARTPAME